MKRVLLIVALSALIAGCGQKIVKVPDPYAVAVPVAVEPAHVDKPKLAIDGKEIPKDLSSLTDEQKGALVQLYVASVKQLREYVNELEQALAASAKAAQETKVKQKAAEDAIAKQHAAVQKEVKQ